MEEPIQQDHLEIFKCPVCIDKIGVYALIECGHNLCSDCIRKIHLTSNQIKCPLCRVLVTEKPIIFQPLASHLEDGVKQITENFFISIFNKTSSVANRLPHSNNHFTQPVTNDLLCIQAFREYSCENITPLRWNEFLSDQYQIDSIYTSIHDIINFSISDVRFALNYEIISPFSNITGTPIVFEDTFNLIERDTRRSDHRRVYLILSNLNIINKIKTVEKLAERFFPGYSLRSELRNRNNLQNTLGVHTGISILPDHSNMHIPISIKLKIAARCVWLNGCNIGVRWHIVKTF
jgi:hypothetical protein